MTSIRKASLNDLETLADIDFQSDHPMDVQRKLTRKQMKKYLSERFKKKQEEFFIYKNKAYITLKRDFPGYKHCEIYWLAVKKSFQRQGLGKKLVKFIEEHAKKLGFRKICLYTGKVMKGAQIFYKKNGFKKVNEFPDHYGFNGTKKEKTAVLFCKNIRW